jgi:hypothetical protein
VGTKSLNYYLLTTHGVPEQMNYIPQWWWWGAYQWETWTFMFMIVANFINSSWAAEAQEFELTPSAIYPFRCAQYDPNSETRTLLKMFLNLIQNQRKCSLVDCVHVCMFLKNLMLHQKPLNLKNSLWAKARALHDHVQVNFLLGESFAPTEFML